MTRFEDQLLDQLMTEHGHQLRAAQQPAPARRRIRRPVWLASGALGAAAAGTAAALALTSAPAAAAYAVSQDHGALTVGVYRASGVAGANGALHKLGARVVVVPVRKGCPSLDSLPRPSHLLHLSMMVSVDFKHGHRMITVNIARPGIPAGVHLILAFTGGRKDALGAGGPITGPVPHCVSLPTGSTIPGGGNSGPGSSMSQSG
jgi:hypothetical protein